MTAPITHIDALEALERALEVEAGATEGEWVFVEGSSGDHGWIEVENTCTIASFDCDYSGSGPADARAVVLARAVVRVSLLGAKAALEQHRPYSSPRYGQTAPPVVPSCRCGRTRWTDCPDARRALDVAAAAGGAL